MKKSFMEQLQEFHVDMQLADKAGALDIPASVMDGINPVRLAFDDIVNNAKETAHIHAFWCSDFFMDTPMVRVSCPTWYSTTSLRYTTNLSVGSI